MGYGGRGAPGTSALGTHSAVAPGRVMVEVKRARALVLSVSV